MPEFLTTRGVTSKIESIISNSKDILFLISPYLSFIPESIIGRIQSSLERKVKVVLVFRSTENIHSNEIQKLNKLRGIEFFYNPNLHAKAFFNEKEAVVTSFNLSGYSEANNIEFGICFTRSDEQPMFEQLIDEVRLILKSSRSISFDGGIITLEKLTENISASGYCIRCKSRINFDYRKPLCFDCHSIWKKFNNRNYRESYCHFCGEAQRTTLNEPICNDCKDQLEIILDFDDDNDTH